MGGRSAVNNQVWRERRLPKQVGERGLRQDVFEGVVAAVKVRLPEPQFKGQTKQELGTPAVEQIVSDACYEAVSLWRSQTGPRAHVRAVATKVIEAAKGRLAARRAMRDRRAAAKIASAALPEKLADCRVHGDGSELLIVEGDSAAGTAKRGRNSERTAVLPLRGKIVNAAKATRKQVLANAEAKALFTAVGAGVGNKVFDLESARYERIVILCDADVDGSHIRCLLLALIHRYMRPMLTAGRVFAAQPPLFTTRVGSEILRAFSDEERDRINRRIARRRRRSGPPRWQRFKGLGEMNTAELAHCALDPATRILRRMTAKDARAAEETIEVLMGANTARRRQFLVEHSDLVDTADLDV